MDISRHPEGTTLTLAVSGRLDAYWAEHLDGTLEEAVREGWRHVRVDMSAVPYVSSAGLGVLVKAHRLLSDAEGTFGVVSPSPAVHKVLAMASLLELLTAEQKATVAAAVAERETEHARVTVTSVPDAAPLTARLIGDPALLAEGTRERDGGGSPEAAGGQPVTVPQRGIVVGVGAFGGDPAECRTRFGELLAAAGSAVTLPTDGATLPDYQLPSAAAVASDADVTPIGVGGTPEIVLLYGVACEGGFSSVLRFDARDQRVPLSELALIALDAAGADLVAFAGVAESAGLVGAALRRSPVVRAAPAESPFAHPGVRTFLSFTPEPAFTRALVLIAGIAARRPGGRIDAFLRPLREPDGPLAHVHAAAFPHRPLRRDHVGLEEAVQALFAGGGPTALLHLLHDSRALAGAGESGFSRGTLWAGPVERIEEG